MEIKYCLVGISTGPGSNLNANITSQYANKYIKSSGFKYPSHPPIPLPTPSPPPSIVHWGPIVVTMEDWCRLSL